MAENNDMAPASVKPVRKALKLKPIKPMGAPVSEAPQKEPAVSAAQTV